ncbi:MAG: hypothetical protein ACRES4_00935, partial [Nevskiales bacterium]
FTLTNGSPRAHSVSQLTFSAGHPEVLSSLSITGGGASFSCVRLTSPAGFRCTANPAAIVPANGSATFTVQASIAAPASAALSQQPGVMLAGASTLGGLMLLGLMGVRRRTLLWLLPVLLALSVLQGCGGGSSNDDDTPPPTSANSTTLSLTGITASDSQGAVSYGGLPLNLGTVTRTP